MRNKYPGYCYKCGKWTEPGFGFFERHNGKWRIQCVKCCDGRTVSPNDKEVRRVNGSGKKPQKK